MILPSIRTQQSRLLVVEAVLPVRIAGPHIVTAVLEAQIELPEEDVGAEDDAAEHGDVGVGKEEDQRPLSGAPDIVSRDAHNEDRAGAHADDGVAEHHNGLHLWI